MKRANCDEEHRALFPPPNYKYFALRTAPVDDPFHINPPPGPVPDSLLFSTCVCWWSVRRRVEALFACSLSRRRQSVSQSVMKRYRSTKPRAPRTISLFPLLSSLFSLPTQYHCQWLSIQHSTLTAPHHSTTFSYGIIFLCQLFIIPPHRPYHLPV